MEEDIFQFIKQQCEQMKDRGQFPYYCTMSSVRERFGLTLRELMNYLSNLKKRKLVERLNTLNQTYIQLVNF